MNKYIEQLNIETLKEHFEIRVQLHKDLQNMLEPKNVKQDYTDFLNLALGISDRYGNFSANEHGLGELILAHNTNESIIKLVGKLRLAEDPKQIPDFIYDANLPYLKISVGSEIALMLQPNLFWVANIRTLWTDFLVSQNYNLKNTNEQLKLYRQATREDSALEYKYWRSEYTKMTNKIGALVDEAYPISHSLQIDTNKYKYIWFDCLANAMYENFSI